MSTTNTSAWGPFYNGNSSVDGYGFFKLDSSRYGMLHGGVGFPQFGPMSGVGQYHIQTATMSSGVERYFVDGQQSGAAVATSAYTPTRSTLVGANDRGAPFQGSIAEVIVYDRALSDTEVASVTSYLQSKYGITG